MIVKVEQRAVMSTSALRRRKSVSMFLLWCVFGTGIGWPNAGMGMPQRANAPFFGAGHTLARLV